MTLLHRIVRSDVPRSVRWGVGLAVLTALISGVSIYVNSFAVKQLPDAAVYTTLKNGVAALILLALAAVLVRPQAVREMRRDAWVRLVLIGVIGGSVPFVLFFTGLAQASAPSAAVIHKTLFVWVALLAVPFLGERLGWAQMAAMGVLLAGQLLVVRPEGIAWGTGETMIAAATLLWAVETILARRALDDVPSPVVGAARLGIGLVVLVGYLTVTGKLTTVAALTGQQWTWALVTGLLLSGYVATWFAALQRAPASLVTAVLVLGAPITALLQVAQGAAIPSVPALAGQGLILLGGSALALTVVRRRVPVGAAVAPRPA
jgi:drug/metabolite transporter (DMT)-like permease